MRIWRVGTRGSILAQCQTDWVLSQLSERFPNFRSEKVIIRTTGDRFDDRPLQQVTGKGFFVKEIEEALLAGEIDFAVHSLKDLPTELPEGLILAAVCNRIEKRDTLVAPQGAPSGASWEQVGLGMGAGARIGTSSPRRQVQLLRYFPSWTFTPVRGNIDTRLKKLDQGQYDGLVLAGAGLVRLGLRDRISAFLPIEVCCPAPGQGALAVEARRDDEEAFALLSTLDEPLVRLEVIAERSVVQYLQAGCRTPLGACGTATNDRLRLRAVIARPDGTHFSFAELECHLNGDFQQRVQQAQELGEQAGKVLQKEMTSTSSQRPSS
ncbi:MAG: hydroxymethylbilane synthase [Armatimonadetes bacterium]|nr:hydroxymethylbilane synthase [Armatimonadota bacterium]MDW8122354.1 hydroxymethylbilane synthase [Armatimonadota bacterium]